MESVFPEILQISYVSFSLDSVSAHFMTVARQGPWTKIVFFKV